MKNLPIVFVSILILLGIYSCKKDFSKISTSDWKPNVAAPFINTTIVLNNLFADDSNLVTLDDSSLVYFYHQDSVFSISADTLLDITEDISDSQLVSLGELYMEQFGFNTDFSMNDVLPFLDQSIQDTLTKYDGSNFYYPPFHITESISIETDAIENYVQLSFSKGKMYLDLFNDLPITLNGIEIQVIDKDFNNLITQINISELASQDTYTDSTDISNMTLGNEFEFVINSLSSAGSFPNLVFIDLTQGLDIGFGVNDIRVVGGQAQIIEQIMYSETKTIDFPIDPAQLRHILFNQGSLNYTLNSDLNLEVKVNLSLPTAEINNQIPSQEFVLDAGGTINNQWDITNMSVDLSSDDSQPYNRMPLQLDILILPTDYIVEFDSSDKVNTYLNMEDLKLEYADGYLGQQTINISKDTFDLDFDFLSRIQGELILEEPSITFNYANSVGVPIRLSTEFLGVNTELGVYEYLDFAQVDIEIPESPGDQVNSQITIDKDNSSIVDFLAIRPNRIIYYGNGLTNPEGPEMNFIDMNSKLVGNALLKIPLIMRANHLSFRDTLGFSGSSEDLPIETAMIQLNVSNGFPMDLSMKFILTDSISGRILDEIAFNEIYSAEVDDDGKVIQETRSEIIVEFDELFLENMKISNRAFLDVETSTFDQGSTAVILYSDYKIDISIGFKAKISP